MQLGIAERFAAHGIDPNKLLGRDDGPHVGDLDNEVERVGNVEELAHSDDVEHVDL